LQPDLIDIITEAGKAYPEVTPAVLPSSLSAVISITLVYSTNPPALVCGTVRSHSRSEDFLVRRIHPNQALASSLHNGSRTDADLPTSA
jgi:hypothetical protein